MTAKPSAARALRSDGSPSVRSAGKRQLVSHGRRVCFARGLGSHTERVASHRIACQCGTRNPARSSWCRCEKLALAPIPRCERPRTCRLAEKRSIRRGLHCHEIPLKSLPARHGETAELEEGRGDRLVGCRALETSGPSGLSLTSYVVCHACTVEHLCTRRRQDVRTRYP
jgi:hypothetical protein